MKKFALLVALVLCVSLTGCVMPMTGLWAPIMVDTKVPNGVGDGTCGFDKVGKAHAQGIILFTSGDASIQAAMDDAGITKVHHVDVNVMNVLGIFVPTDPKAIAARLAEKGWQASVATNPECLRLVIMPHVGRESVDGLFAALEEVLADA